MLRMASCSRETSLCQQSHTSIHDALVQVLDMCHVRVCRAQWPAVRDHFEGGGEQAGHPPLAGVHLVLLLPHLCPGNGSLLVSLFSHLHSLYP